MVGKAGFLGVQAMNASELISYVRESENWIEKVSSFIMVCAEDTVR
jgi:hypothetical protein